MEDEQLCKSNIMPTTKNWSSGCFSELVALIAASVCSYQTEAKDIRLLS